MITQARQDIADGLAEVVTDLGEDVVFHGTTDETVQCLVELDEAIRNDDGDEPATFVGQVLLPLEHKDTLELDSTPVTTCTVQAQVWHIVDVGADQHGLIPLGIRRHVAEITHSNRMGLDDRQASWG